MNGSYEAPIVPMTALPSPAFGTALDGIRAGTWRGGTPTLHVVNGVLSYIADNSAAGDARYVFVLVTDGYPQGCNDNSIQSVVDAVTAVAAQTPTYVIGVANPPLTDANGMMAPETVMNLSAVAVAGGTDHAYLIDTGNPALNERRVHGCGERNPQYRHLVRAGHPAHPRRPRVRTRQGRRHVHERRHAGRSHLRSGVQHAEHLALRRPGCAHARSCSAS